jgi:phage anti-repressor protein
MTAMIKPEQFDFNALVHTNTGISIEFKSKIVDSVKESFTPDEQQWFLANLYVYLNYDSTKDFPVSLETVYKLIGFSTKANAKRTLLNNFIIDEDYKITLIIKDERVHGGQNEENIMLNVDTFKNLCLMAKSEKGKKIRKYYVKLENILNKLINDERVEFENKIKELQNKLDVIVYNVSLDKKIERENILLNSFKSKNVFYLCLFEWHGKVYIKYGYSQGYAEYGISSRLKCHKKEISENLFLVNVIECVNCVELERRFKRHSEVLCKNISKKFTNNKNKIEIIELDDAKTVEEYISQYTQIANVIKDQLVEYEYIAHELNMKELETKQKETEHITRQKELDLEILKIKAGLSTIKEVVQRPVAQKVVFKKIIPVISVDKVIPIKFPESIINPEMPLQVAKKLIEIKVVSEVKEMIGEKDTSGMVIFNDTSKTRLAIKQDIQRHVVNYLKYNICETPGKTIIIKELYKKFLQWLPDKNLLPKMTQIKFSHVANKIVLYKKSGIVRNVSFVS